MTLLGDWQEVDWSYPVTVNVNGTPEESVNWRTCDFCYESYMHDCWANRPIRKFYRSEEEGLIACERCLPEAMADEPVLVESTAPGR